MRESAHKKMQDQISGILERLRSEAMPAEVAVTCPACNGYGFAGEWQSLKICQTCNGQRMIVETQNKLAQ